MTCLNPKVIVHAAKLKVDGITKYLDNTNFKFDHVRRPFVPTLKASGVAPIHSARGCHHRRTAASYPCSLGMSACVTTTLPVATVVR